MEVGVWRNAATAAAAACPELDVEPPEEAVLPVDVEVDDEVEDELPHAASESAAAMAAAPTALTLKCFLMVFPYSLYS